MKLIEAILEEIVSGASDGIEIIFACGCILKLSPKKRLIKEISALKEIENHPLSTAGLASAKLLDSCIKLALYEIKVDMFSNVTSKGEGIFKKNFKPCGEHSELKILLTEIERLKDILFATEDYYPTRKKKIYCIEDLNTLISKVFVEKI